MRKINLADYTVKRMTLNPNPNERPTYVELPYFTRDSILAILFHPGLRLTGASLVRYNALALKIEACKGDEVLLTDDEYDRLKAAVDTAEGFSRDEVELVARIANASEVEEQT